MDALVKNLTLDKPVRLWREINPVPTKDKVVAPFTGPHISSINRAATEDRPVRQVDKIRIRRDSPAYGTARPLHSR